ncbi:hypothetical protein Bpfe_004123, partial [Biomphalaria pfeifferi]
MKLADTKTYIGRSDIQDINLFKMEHLALIWLTLCFGATVTASALCRDPEYLAHLKDEVRPFYRFYEDENGHQIARPLWLVSMDSNVTSVKSTCPWATYIDTSNN